MSSTNAFCQPQHALPVDHILRTTHPESFKEQSSKKRKLNLNPEILSRQVDETIGLDTDLMILEYLAHQIIVAGLQENSNISSKCDRRRRRINRTNVDLFNNFQSIFKTRHPNFAPNAELQFQLGLLKFVTLYNSRFKRSRTTPSSDSLKHLRTCNQHRARDWIGHPSRLPSRFSNEIAEKYELELPFAQAELTRNKLRIFEELGLESQDDTYEDNFYGSSSSVSLLDLLPLFVKISATLNGICSAGATRQWMNLAADYMMQACLEQYLVYGASGLDAIDEALAYGYRDNLEGTDNSASEIEPDHEVNAMFEHPRYAEEMAGWSDIKRSILTELMNYKHETLLSKLRSAAKKHPMHSFHNELMSYLRAVSQAIAKPVLSQLESGKLDDLTEQETEALIERCGGAKEIFHSD